MSKKIDVLLLESLPDFILSLLAERFVLHSFTTLQALTPLAGKIRAIVTGGSTGVAPDIMAALPNLEIVAFNGVGTDRIDLAEAKRRGIHVSITTGLGAEDVADMAMMLTLAVRRNLCQNTAFMRAGAWKHTALPPLAQSVTRAKMGLVGLGYIGQAIARRALGFEMELAYFNRREKILPDGLPLVFMPDLVALAHWADILVIAIVGGKETAGLIDQNILEALGPKGVLINIARGSIIEESALLHALKAGQIAGAGLDVFQHEPHINPGFFDLPNIVLQPHQGSATVQARQAMGENIIANLIAHFEGRVLPSAIL